MRITNKMMTNNMLHNINTNKSNMTTLENKYASGMEIQKPSDDPIVAVRALKLRTNLSELNQYYQKNIPDAKSWMETTENALHNTSEIITNIHTYCVQGANDPLTEKERQSIVDNLKELKNQAYQEGNSNYAGRYLFTGYKTDTSLMFESQEKNLEYSITEDIPASDIEISDRVINSLDVSTLTPDNCTTAFASIDRPESNTIYRIRLAYDNLKDGGDVTLNIPKLKANGEYDLDANGNRQYDASLSRADMKVVSASDPKAYAPGDDEVIFIEDTGEIILGQNKYNAWRNSKFEITYEKNSFDKDELRPEHYFKCTKYDLTIPDATERANKAINYDVEDQKIRYEINFNQRLEVNIQAKDAYRHSLGRSIDDMVKSIDDVNATQEKIARVEKMLEDTSLTDEQKTKLNEINGYLKSELSLKEGLIREAFGRGLTAMSKEENAVNAATSDIGTRYSRVELTEDRLSTQQVEFTELLSQNEDADLVDTIVNYNAANTVYNASLQAAGKVVKNTLLDFL